MANEKTEKATAKKREDERKKGNVFQSNDLVIAASLLIVFASFNILSGYIFRLLQYILTKYLNGAASVQNMSISSVMILLVEIILYLSVLTLPFLLISMLANILVSGTQTRFIFKNLKFDLKKLDPIKGFKKMFSLRVLVDLAKSMLKLVVICYLAYTGVREMLSMLLKLTDMSILSGFVFIAKNAYGILMKICILIFVLGVIDYLYQWWEYERNIRMSKQDIKDENKQMEGDPQIKGAIRSRQKSMAMSRMMQKLPDADVVVVNPTHFAVALQYNSNKNKSPIVIAKGKDLVALRIKEKAKELEIEIVENPPLARGLFKAVEIGREIPPEFYQAVAEILAFIYKSGRKANKSKRGVLM